ncbi:alkene reductase [Corynebacterium ulceribovis]|uniref:alkene reductase n=1 Tax=Corynebacterium ulceribovis TaxID=487732 RepID=UPI0004773045|nr:alkene reductase [Corynebacterium ulceribovis]
MISLHNPIDVGKLTLPNRVVMAPLTRTRAPGQAANELIAEYYRQRATAGLIIAEGTFISEEARGFAAVPGIWTNHQVDGWAQVTDAVHEAGGRIFAQLWHVGRVSHAALQPDNGAPLSSTSHGTDRARAYIFDASGEARFVEPTAPQGMNTDQIAKTIRDYARAAENAMDAGFDGVEIHAANGYLIEQFINPNINDRSDSYHAFTVENRLRFPLEVVAAVTKQIGKNRTGIRLSPWGTASGAPLYPEISETYLALGDALSGKVAYVHFNDQAYTGRGGHPGISPQWLPKFRDTFAGPVIVTGGMTKERAEDYLNKGCADLIGFGRDYIANPDLVERLRTGAPLAEANPETYYTQTAEGYTDYPSYQG